MGDITQLLDDARAGKSGAHDTLFKAIYDELRKIARAQLSSVPPITVLDAPGLVHEAYLKLMQRPNLPPTANRHLFYGYAASIMRSVIVDCLREKGAAKRGAGERGVTLQTRDLGAKSRDLDIEALDDALHDLRKIDERCCQVVEMRYFAGMSIEEVADAMGISGATVERDWKKARAYLFDVLKQRE